MKLVCSDYSEERKNARFKGWAQAIASARFVVLRDSGDIVANVNWGGPAVTHYSVGFADEQTGRRIIPRKEVIPTVRLYLDAQRLRKSLDRAVMMFVSPV